MLGKFLKEHRETKLIKASVYYLIFVIFPITKQFVLSSRMSVCVLSVSSAKPHLAKNREGNIVIIFSSHFITTKFGGSSVY